MNSTPVSAESTADVVAATSAELVAADAPKPSRRRNTSDKDFLNQNSEGAKDAVAVHNKFGALEEMEFTPSHSLSRAQSVSPKNNNGRIFPVMHKKSRIIQHLFNGTVEF